MHHLIPQLDELLRAQDLSEYVGQILLGIHMRWHYNILVTDGLAPLLTAVNVLHLSSASVAL